MCQMIRDSLHQPIFAHLFELLPKSQLYLFNTFQSVNSGVAFDFHLKFPYSRNQIIVLNHKHRKKYNRIHTEIWNQ